jgi:hypothetical protein
MSFGATIGAANSFVTFADRRRPARGGDGIDGGAIGRTTMKSIARRGSGNTSVATMGDTMTTPTMIEWMKIENASVSVRI